MKILSTQEFFSMEQFFKLDQDTLRDVIGEYLKGIYDDIIITDEYIFAEGDVPIGLVAHFDTVFDRPPQSIFYDNMKSVMWSPDGLGADDRAGVYSIIQILKMGFRPSVILLTDEEKGGLGASIFIEDFPHSPKKLKYLIELDRKDSDDCVFYNCWNRDFIDYIESFGFITNFGSFSDISFICPVWGIAGVNLSIGYYNEHTYCEFLHVGQMYNTISKIIKMILDIDNIEKFEYKIRKDESIKIDEEVQCDKCGIIDYKYNFFPVADEEIDKIIYLCIDCLLKKDNLHWCISCGNPFVNKNENELYCKKCREINNNDI